MWKSALHLARKDLRLFFRDRTALSLALVLPIVLATVFGTAMKGMSGGGGGVGGMKAIALVVQDDDRSPSSENFVRLLSETEGILVQPEPDGRAVVRNGKAAMALVIPEGYGSTLEGGEMPELVLLKDPSKVPERPGALRSHAAGLDRAKLGSGARPGLPQPAGQDGFPRVRGPKRRWRFLKAPLPAWSC